jgi:hypothetical protein
MVTMTGIAQLLPVHTTVHEALTTGPADSAPGEPGRTPR